MSSYNDNLYAANVGQLGDFITAIAPSFDLKSNFGANALNLSAGAVFSRYVRHPGFDTDDAFANANGRLDLGVDEDVHGTLRIVRQHEDPGAPNVPGAIAVPIEFLTYGGSVGIENTRSRIGYSADLSATRQEYEAVPLIGGGLLPLSDENNVTYVATLQGSYEFRAHYRGFVSGSLNYQDYDEAALGAPIRTSWGYHADSGIRIDLTGLIFVNFFLGYMEEYYQAKSSGHGVRPGRRRDRRVERYPSHLAEPQSSAQYRNCARRSGGHCARASLCPVDGWRECRSRIVPELIAQRPLHLWQLQLPGNRPH